MLGTYRSEETGAGLKSLLARLMQGPRLLGRLEEGAVGSMAGDMLALNPPPRAFVEFLTRQSEGNPFFLAEYLRAAVEEGLLGRDREGRWQVMAASPGEARQYEALALPRSLRELVERRLQGLPERARHAASVAAVLGREPALGLLCATAGASEDELQPALAELLRRQVVELTWEGRYRFAHDKIREVAYGAVPRDQRAALHRAAAQALERQREEGFEEDSAALGDHWKGAGEPAQARPCYLRAARKAAAVYDHAQAERLYRAYLDLSPTPSPETITARNELAVRVLAIRGRSEEALAQSREALAHAQSLGDLTGQGSSLQEIGFLLYVQGRLDEARTLFDQALAMHRSAGHRQAEGDTLDNLANTLWQQGRLDEARTLFEQALSIHREVQNQSSEAKTLNNLAGISWQQGSLQQAQGLSQQALEIFHQIGDLRHEGPTLSNLALLQTALGSPEESARLYEQALTIHREVGDRRSETHTLREMSRLERQAFGDLGRAERHIEAAESIASETGNAPLLAVCLCERGHIALAQGLSGQAFLDRASEPIGGSAEILPGPVGQALERLRRAEQALRQGGRLFRGECPDDLPEGLLRWLVRTQQIQMAMASSGCGKSAAP